MNSAKRQAGQSLTEYAILLSVVAVASIAVTSLFGAALKSKIASLGAAIAGKSAQEVSEFERQSQSQAESAAKLANEVDGMKVSESEIAPEGRRGRR
jgi:Flp pilus assembly pilin Flp